MVAAGISDLDARVLFLAAHQKEWFLIGSLALVTLDRSLCVPFESRMIRPPMGDSGARWQSFDGLSDRSGIPRFV